MRLLVTGLCLQGNKGGPALALALRRELERELGTLNWMFSVPSRELDREKEWATTYGVGVVGDPGLRDLLPHERSRHLPPSAQQVTRWFRELRHADAVIDLSAISYVGPPTGSLRAALLRRFRYFSVSHALRRPFLAWTQSYGPFTTRSIRILARADLSRLPTIYCRGRHATDAVRTLLPSASTRTFPDVATVLPYDRERGAEILQEFGATRDTTATVSPSSVLYSRGVGSGTTNSHVVEMAEIVEHLTNVGHDVVLVPHTFRPNRPDPRLCDAAVASLVRDRAAHNRTIVIDDDLSPIDLKSVISQASLHVGARYHSVVAALSSGVPCLSLSWHPKYRDIMRFYGVEDYVVERGEGNRSADLLTALMERNNELREQLRFHQDDVAREVRRNGAMFADDLQNVLR